LDEARVIEERESTRALECKHVGLEYEHVGSAEEYVDSDTSTGALQENEARLKKGSAYTQQYEINTNGAWTIIGI